MAKKLKDIRENKNYFIDLFLREFNQNIEEKFEEKKFELEDIFRHNSYEDIVRYEHYIDGFTKNKLKIGPIILGKDVPDIILHNIYNIRECYCLGLYEASIVYCRAVIESAVVDFLVRKGKIDNNPDRFDDKLSNYMKYYMYDYLRGNRPIYFKIGDIIRIANGILHKRSFIQEIDDNETAEYIMTTIKFIEYIFTI